MKLRASNVVFFLLSSTFILSLLVPYSHETTTPPDTEKKLELPLRGFEGKAKRGKIFRLDRFEGDLKNLKKNADKSSFYGERGSEQYWVNIGAIIFFVLIFIVFLILCCMAAKKAKSERRRQIVPQSQSESESILQPPPKPQQKITETPRNHRKKFLPPMTEEAEILKPANPVHKAPELPLQTTQQPQYAYQLVPTTLESSRTQLPNDVHGYKLVPVPLGAQPQKAKEGNQPIIIVLPNDLSSVGGTPVLLPVPAINTDKSGKEVSESEGQASQATTEASDVN